MYESSRKSLVGEIAPFICRTTFSWDACTFAHERFIPRKRLNQKLVKVKINKENRREKSILKSKQDLSRETFQWIIEAKKIRVELNSVAND